MPDAHQQNTGDSDMTAAGNEWPTADNSDATQTAEVLEWSASASRVHGTLLVAQDVIQPIGSQQTEVAAATPRTHGLHVGAKTSPQQVRQTDLDLSSISLPTLPRDGMA